MYTAFWNYNDLSRLLTEIQKNSKKNKYTIVYESRKCTLIHFKVSDVIIPWTLVMEPRTETSSLYFINFTITLMNQSFGITLEIPPVSVDLELVG